MPKGMGKEMERKTLGMSISDSGMGGQQAFYEQLTADSAAVLLIDHQVGLFSGVVDFDVLTLKHNVVALAKAAKVLGPYIAEFSAFQSSFLLTDENRSQHTTTALTRLGINWQSMYPLADPGDLWHTTL